MADSTPLAGLLDRAGSVFSLADRLGFAFRDEYDRQGTGLRTVDPTAWSRHKAAFNTFSAAVLDLRDEMQNPPNGFAPVAQVLMEAARLAKQIRDTMQTTHGQTWQSFLDFRFHFNSIVANGNEVIHAATKPQRLDDPFALLEQPAKSTTGPICITPTIPKPPAKLIEAAERSIPVILADVPSDSMGQTTLPSAAHFVARMQKAGHTLAAAQWAIHESVIAGRLETVRVEVELPSVMTDAGWSGGGRGTKAIPKDTPAPFDCFKVVPTGAMSAWWRSWDAPPPQPSLAATPDPYAKLARSPSALITPASPTPAVTERIEGGNPPADLYETLRQFARADLKGQERAVIEALCDADGELPIADLAVMEGVGWQDPFDGFKGAQRRLNPKLKPHRWRMERRNNAAYLVSM